MLRKAFYFSFFSKHNWSSTDRVPIKPNREYHLKSLKISIGQKWLQSIEKHIRLIEYQSRINRTNSRPSFKNQGIFDQSKNTFDQSKFWKAGFFEKLQKFM